MVTDLEFPSGALMSCRETHPRRYLASA